MFLMAINVSASVQLAWKKLFLECFLLETVQRKPTCRVTVPAAPRSVGRAQKKSFKAGKKKEKKKKTTKYQVNEHGNATP